MNHVGWIMKICMLCWRNIFKYFPNDDNENEQKKKTKKLFLIYEKQEESLSSTVSARHKCKI